MCPDVPWIFMLNKIIISTLCNLLFRTPLLFQIWTRWKLIRMSFSSCHVLHSLFVCVHFFQSKKLLWILLLSVDSVLNTGVFVFSEVIKHHASVLVMVP